MTNEIETPYYQQIRAALTHRGFLAVVNDAFPKGCTLDATRLAWTFVNLIETPNDRGKTPLLSCSISSLRRAMLSAATVGLEPGLGGACWIIPRGDSATFQMGALGYIELALRAGAKRVWCDIIYEADEYKVIRGEEPRLEHDISESWMKTGSNASYDHKNVVPVEEGGRGLPLGAYACLEMPDGSVAWSIVTEAECQMARSVSFAQDSPAYKKWPDQMRLRTAISRARKMWPRKILSVVESDGEVSSPLIERLEALETQGKVLPSKKPTSALDVIVSGAKALPDPETAAPQVVETAKAEPSKEEQAAILAEERRLDERAMDGGG